MYYINYYSRARNKINMTNSELDKELAYNTNRIVTKEVEHCYKPSDNIIINLNMLYVLIQQYINRNRIASIPFENSTNKYHEFMTEYESFKIPKRKGGYRTITAPKDNLKHIQKLIVRAFTKNAKFLAHNAAHGFTKNRNCKTALKVHQDKKSRWFLKLDIKDFFPHTTYDMVYHALDNTYPFCTMDGIWKYTITCACTCGLATPQGAPTSPLITNMVMIPFDEAITKYCKSKGLTYTRYADDLLISGRVGFDWVEVARSIQDILNPHYQLNHEKTRYGNFNGRNWNLGLMYNNNYEVTVGHAKKKLVKNMLHNYTTKEELQTYENYYKLLGTISYCYYIEPEYFKPYMNEIKSIRPS